MPKVPKGSQPSSPSGYDGSPSEVGAGVIVGAGVEELDADADKELFSWSGVTEDGEGATVAEVAVEEDDS